MDARRLEGFTHHILLGEVAFQSELAAKAAERLPACFDDEFDSIEVWGAVQSILIAAGNVSKILWPHRSRSARGEALRGLLGLTDASPLADRTFRNHFEHYDDRIEEWMAESPTASYVDQKIGPSAFDRSFPRLVHRHYDPCTKELIFRNESMSLASVLEELKLIRQRCSSFVLT